MVRGGVYLRGTDFNWSEKEFVQSLFLIEHILFLIVAFANFVQRIVMSLSLSPSTRLRLNNLNIATKS